jgi:polysaccharide export outer membrane protein
VRAVSRTILAVGILTLPSSGEWLLAQQPATAPSDKEPAAQAGYTIGPADVLQIIVWKEPDLTRDVTVRFDGMITLPLLGDLEASGRTPAQLAESLSKELGRFVELPRVTVGVLQANSARFYVVGQVGRSGEFPLSGRTTVLQAIALAGGFKDFAKTDGIVIVRRDQTIIPVNYKRIADGSDVSRNVQLLPGDTILVP